MVDAFKTIPFLPVHLGNTVSHYVILLFISPKGHWKCTPKGTENALYFPQADAFSSWCTQVSHCPSKCSCSCISLFRAVLPGVHQCSKENLTGVKAGKNASHCSIRLCTERHLTEIAKITGFLTARQKLFCLSLPSPLQSQADFWGAGEESHVQDFLLTALDWGRCHRFFDIQASLESSFLMFFIALA